MIFFVTQILFLYLIWSTSILLIQCCLAEPTELSECYRIISFWPSKTIYGILILGGTRSQELHRHGMVTLITQRNCTAYIQCPWFYSFDIWDISITEFLLCRSLHVQFTLDFFCAVAVTGFQLLSYILIAFEG